MISIIVFPKGRPMQLHAYLESLLKFSDVQQKNISILYCETTGIHYEKVKSSFPETKWIKENGFENNLKEMIQSSDDFIMFGCDDVVFTSKFSLKNAVEYLKKQEDTLGYSVRLGANIEPRPINLSNTRDFYKWDWSQSKERHYNYPWELDCTLYRKEDVVRIINMEKGCIRNPNFFEAMITPENREDRLKRKKMVCSTGKGCAVVITVNRVQDTHPNGFDDCMKTDILSLDKIYNEDGNRLDIERIAALPNKEIHVGAEFFILRKHNHDYSNKKIIIKKYQKIIRKLIGLPKRVDRFIEKRKYINNVYANKLNILDPIQSIELINKNQSSFLRFGDGELALIHGEGIPFQEYDAELSGKLNKLLTMDVTGIEVGIPYFYFHYSKDLNRYVEEFAYSQKKLRMHMIKKCNRSKQYIDTTITQIYQTYKNFLFEMYYQRTKDSFVNRDVSVICGEGVLNKLEYNPLAECKSVHYISAPSMNAYREYSSILNRALQEEKTRLILIILGPTAKPLVYDLVKAGYQAWDMGHYFKDFDAYKKQSSRTPEEITNFYQPD